MLRLGLRIILRLRRLLRCGILRLRGLLPGRVPGLRLRIILRLRRLFDRLGNRLGNRLPDSLRLRLPRAEELAVVAVDPFLHCVRGMIRHGEGLRLPEGILIHIVFRKRHLAFMGRFLSSARYGRAAATKMNRRTRIRKAGVKNASTIWARAPLRSVSAYSEGTLSSAYPR